jgi:hypothetical protein
MSGTEQKYERIIKYLKGLLSNRERYDLEKEMMQEPFEEEAFDGLTRISADELEADMELLGNRLKERIEPDRKRSLGIFYRIAAGIILLAGIAGILYLVFRMPPRSLLTEETGEVTHQVPPAVISQAVTDTVFPEKAKSEIEHEPVQSPPVVTGKSVRHEKVSEEAKITTTVTEAVTAEAVAEEHMAGREAVEEEEIAKREPVADERMTEIERANEKIREPAVSNRKSEAAAPSAMEKARAVLPAAKVVDIDGNPLPGVTVLEKGSTRGTVTDMEGMLSLQVFDSGSVLSLTYIGYVPVEMKAKDIAGKEISMTEDLVALEEVVVVGYGVQKKSDVTGAVSALSAEDISPRGEPGISSIVNPVPPGGSVKAFKQWVYERLDDLIVGAFPEKQKILVNITVQTDGSVSDIRIKETVPEPLAEEFRRIISQSPRWKPAMEDNKPVVAKVAIRFVIGEE